jgi:hypothetical protein
MLRGRAPARSRARGGLRDIRHPCVSRNGYLPALRTYSQRAAAIAKTLSSVVDLSKYAASTYASNPPDLEMANGLKCSWSESEYGLPRVTVFVEAIDDINDKVRACRDHVANFLERGESDYDPASASELATDRPDEYVFFNYVEDVTALVGHCQVTIMPSLQQIKGMDHDYPDLELADFVDAALEIGRTLGCSPYDDDFVRPDFPEKWTRHSWTAFPPSSPAE